MGLNVVTNLLLIRNNYFSPHSDPNSLALLILCEQSYFIKAQTLVTAILALAGFTITQMVINQSWDLQEFTIQNEDGLMHWAPTTSGVIFSIVHLMSVLI